MKKCLIVVTVVAVGLVLVAKAEAVMAQLGGQIYATEKVIVGDTAYIRLRSYEVAPDWSFVGYVNQGDVVDNDKRVGYVPAPDGSYYWTKGQRPGVLSPEVESYGGQNYGTIVLGAWYNNSPASYTEQTMDVLRLSPSAGGLAAPTILGDGRNGNNTWGDWQHPPNKNTSVGWLAAPDPVGGFTGGVDNYLVHTTAYQSTLHIVSDPGGDCTDADSDYIASRGKKASGFGNDFEILGNKYMVSEGWSGYGPAGAISYWERLPDGTISDTGIDYKSRILFAGANKAVPEQGTLTGLNSLSGTYLAAGNVAGHAAVWAYADNVLNGQGIYCFVDYDDSGYITSGEYFKAYDSADANVHGVDNPSSYLWRDLEWAQNADGKMFLIATSVSENWDVGNAFIIIGLDDNGDFTGGNDMVRVLSEYVSGTGKGTQNFVLPGTQRVYSYDPYTLEHYEDGVWATEFDKNTGTVIPEPTTLLLLGTGVMGALGYFRRRRMM